MFAKIKSAVTELGVGDGLGYLLDQLLAARLKIGGFTRYVLTAQPVPAGGGMAMGRLEVREAKAGDPALAGLPVDDQVLAYRFGQGAVCLVALDEGKTVGSIWFCFGAYDEDMVRCRFLLLPAATTAWDFDVYVAPDHRLGRTFARMWAAANAYLRARGVQWSLSRVSAYNVASLQSHKRLGARAVGRATFLTLGPLQIMWSTARPRCHVSWGTGRPELEVKAPQNTPSP